MHRATVRAQRVAADLRARGVPVRDLEVLDAFLNLIGEGQGAEAEFVAWVTGEVDARAAELADAVIARAKSLG